MVADEPDRTQADEPRLAIVSFTEFYESQFRAAVRLAASLVGRWDTAEEIAQDAFVALHARWARVSQYESPEGWLRRVVLNRSLSALRRRRVELRLLGRLARQRARPVELPASGSEVWRAVAALPKRQAQVIALMFVEDLGVGEIAAVLECDETTVRTHLRRARLTLAQRLNLEVEGS